MSLQLVFASSNANKLTEIKLLLPQNIELLGSQDIHFTDEIEETGKTFEDNAALKANAVFEFSKLNCFADDSGLEVDALDGKPGVKSARYAGEPVDHQKNIELLLANLQGKKSRKARFKTVVCLRTASKTFFFEGTVNGTITEQPLGDNGFGYDPVFMPEGSERTFAQMNIDEKNAISHRKKAIAKMIDFIQYL